MNAVAVRPPLLPALVVGRVAHTRSSPRRYSFQHRHVQWLIDVDQPPRLPLPLRWLARFPARDHLAGGGIRHDLSDYLAGYGITLAPTDQVLMLAHGRSAGYVFNPLTVFWCLRADRTLAALVLEVHNTYGGRHTYLFEQPSGTVDKTFYVSPFNDVSGRYRVRTRLAPDRVAVSIVLERAGRQVLSAATSGQPVPATTSAVLRHSLVQAPLGVSALIRLHGIRLWRRLPMQPRPTGAAR